MEFMQTIVGWMNVQNRTVSDLSSSLETLTGSENKEGLREGIIRSINPTLRASHEVYFPESNTTIRTRVSTLLGFLYYPRGTLKKGILYPDEEIHVMLQKSGNDYQIIDAINESVDVDVGATIIERNGSKLIIKENLISLESCGMIIRLDCSGDPCPQEGK